MIIRESKCFICNIKWFNQKYKDELVNGWVCSNHSEEEKFLAQKQCVEDFKKDFDLYIKGFEIAKETIKRSKHD